jgi:predicted helicase
MTGLHPAAFVAVTFDSRSALEWLIDQYRAKGGRDSRCGCYSPLLEEYAK